MASRKPSGLGRGLGALLGDDVLKTETAGALYLPISEVESNSSQPRKNFDEEALAGSEADLRVLSDHRRRTPLACCPAGRPAGGAGDGHRG